MSVSKNTVTVIFIVDTSGSMYGQKIAAVNAAIAECLAVLRKYQNKNENLMTGYITFDEKIGNFILKKDLGTVVFKVEPNGSGFYNMTLFSCLYEGMDKVLRNYQNFRSDLCLFLITDGKPADSGEYTEPLEKVKSLEPFRRADRYVVLVGNDVNGMDNDVLEFVGFKANQVVQLSDLSGVLERMQMLAADAGSSYADDKERYKLIFGD